MENINLFDEQLIKNKLFIILFVLTTILEMSVTSVNVHSPALPWRPSTSPGKVDRVNNPN